MELSANKPTMLGKSEESLLSSLPPWEVKSSGKYETLADDKMDEFLTRMDKSSDTPSKYCLCLDDNVYQGPWKVLLGPTALKRDALHQFELQAKEIGDIGLVSHVMFFGVPNGGINRLGLYG
jgi:hypothetical protein